METESATTDAYCANITKNSLVSFAQAISNLPNSVKLIGVPHPDPRIQYYRVEKFNNTINKWIHLKTVNERLSVEYIDTGLDNNSTHKYRIKAFTFNDVESAPTRL